MAARRALDPGTASTERGAASQSSPPPSYRTKNGPRCFREAMFEVANAIADAELELVVEAEPHPATRRLMDELGVRIRVEG